MLDERLVAMLLVAAAVALQLDVRGGPGRSTGDASRTSRARCGSLVAQEPHGKPLVAAGQAVEPRGVLRDEIPVVARLALRPAQRTRGEELAEVAVAVAAFDEKRQARRIGQATMGERVRYRAKMASDDRVSSFFILTFVILHFAFCARWNGD